MSDRIHLPVMISEVFDNINLSSDSAYLDLTFGEGGHSEEFLKRGVKSLVGVDRDKSTLDRYLATGLERNNPKLGLVHARFTEYLQSLESNSIDGILIDLGVSTRQLLTQERGFSFQNEGPLDMRMNPEAEETLLEKLTNMSEEDLAFEIKRNTDMEGSRGIARKIKMRLNEGRIKSTLDLAQVVPKTFAKTHPATVLFLALRMMVNDELEEARVGILESIRVLKPGGRLVVLTFHSTEDRQVKVLFNTLAGKCVCKQMRCLCPRIEKVKSITGKPLIPSEDEVRSNPRARSTKLRCVEKICD